MNRVPLARRVFFGWWIAIAAAAIWTYGDIHLYFGFTAFVDPIAEEFHWSRAAVSLGGAVLGLGSGIGSFVAGFLTVRLRARKVIVGSLTLAVVGHILLAQARPIVILGLHVDALGVYLFAFLAIALGWGAGEVIPETAVLANWFRKRRGLALTIASTGGALAGFGVPGLVLLIDGIGWRSTQLLVAAGTVALVFPLVALFRWRPEAYGLRTYGEPRREEPASAVGTAETPINLSEREALRTRPFWLLAIGLSLWSLTTTGIGFHILSHLVDVGWGRATASFVLAGLAAGSLAGRLGFGFASDYLDRRHLLAVCMALQAVGLVFLSGAASPWLIIPFLLTYPFGRGGPVAVQMAITAEYFGTERFAAIQGMMHTIMVVGGMLGPLLVGILYDQTETYTAAFLLLALLLGLTVPFFLSVTQPRTLAPSEGSERHRPTG